MPRPGIEALMRGMTAYFESVSFEARVAFGLRARDEWARTRVVIIPGRFDGRAPAGPMPGGVFGPALHKASTNPSELARWTRELTFSLFAVDPTDASNDLAQNRALEDLLERFHQSIWRGQDPEGSALTPPIGAAGIVFGETIVMKPPTSVGSYGEEVLLQATMLTPFLDAPQGVARPPFVLNKSVSSSAPVPGGASGTSASITSASSGLMAVSRLAGQANASWVTLRYFLALSNASNPGNNGVFPIVGFTSSSAVVVANAAAVAPDASNGALVWSLNATGE